VFLETLLFERGPFKDPDPSLTITTVLFFFVQILPRLRSDAEA
jgi:hypothetical protein